MGKLEGRIKQPRRQASFRENAPRAFDTEAANSVTAAVSAELTIIESDSPSTLIKTELRSRHRRRLQTFQNIGNTHTHAQTHTHASCSDPTDLLLNHHNTQIPNLQHSQTRECSWEHRHRLQVSPAGKTGAERPRCKRNPTPTRTPQRETLGQTPTQMMYEKTHLRLA